MDRTYLEDPTSEMSNMADCVDAVKDANNIADNVPDLDSTYLLRVEDARNFVATETTCHGNSTNSDWTEVHDSGVTKPAVTDLSTPVGIADPAGTDVRNPERISDPDITDVPDSVDITDSAGTDMRNPEGIADSDVTDVLNPEGTTDPDVTDVRSEGITAPDVTDVRNPEDIAGPDVKGVPDSVGIADPDVKDVPSSVGIADPDVKDVPDSVGIAADPDVKHVPTSVGIADPDVKHVPNSVGIADPDVKDVPDSVGIADPDVKDVPDSVGIADPDVKDVPDSVGIADPDVKDVPDSVDIADPAGTDLPDLPLLPFANATSRADSEPCAGRFRLQTSCAGLVDLKRAISGADCFGLVQILESPESCITAADIKECLTAAVDTNWDLMIALLLLLLSEDEAEFHLQLLRRAIASEKWLAAGVLISHGRRYRQLGETDLMLAVQPGVTVEFARQFAPLDPVNCADLHGRTALSYAAQCGLLGLVRFLVKELGASICLTDSQGLKPLDYAMAALDSIDDSGQRVGIGDVIEFLDSVTY